MNNDAPRVCADCRKMGGTCSVSISGTEGEVMDLAVMHAVTTHEEKDTPEFRDMVRKMLAPATD